MKVSYNWLNRYFDGKLPTPDVLAEKLTFHAWEIEEVAQIGDDTVLDVKVLPDKSMWALSHRGIAKDLSVILNLPISSDPLAGKPDLTPVTGEIAIKIESPNCRRFAAALIRGVKVGPSPAWLKTSLESIGQRSINNVVDASNFVMFDLGQPSHAFDAKNLPGGVLVRQAKAGEKLSALDQNEYVFTEDDTLISSLDGRALSIAGIKGGQDSGITDATTDIVVEVANWDPVTTRKSAQRLKLRSDASSRYENGIVPEMVPFGIQAVVELILQVAGGELVGYAEAKAASGTDNRTVPLKLSKINSVLGVDLTTSDVTDVFDRFGWKYEVDGEDFTVTSPFERTDLVIVEDVIEEIGRIYGYEHVTAVTPEPIPLKEINQRFYYSELIRETLTGLGFSEIYTSSFREHDEVKLANAFAADKGYLRSTLMSNMAEALQKNSPNADLLGLKQIKMFEIGTVFGEAGERSVLCLGVQSPSGYKTKLDDPAIYEATTALSAVLGTDVVLNGNGGAREIDLGDILKRLPLINAYKPAPAPVETTYRPFSVYPAVSRDIAMWVSIGTVSNDIAELIRAKAGPLCVRVTLFDQFEKDGRVSFAFRLVFQSHEKTLEGGAVDTIMDGIYQAVRERGYEVR